MVCPLVVWKRIVGMGVPPRNWRVPMTIPVAGWARFRKKKVSSQRVAREQRIHTPRTNATLRKAVRRLSMGHLVRGMSRWRGWGTGGCWLRS